LYSECGFLSCDSIIALFAHNLSTVCAVDETRVDLAEKFEVGTKFINASFIDVSVSWACVFIALISFRIFPSDTVTQYVLL